MKLNEQRTITTTLNKGIAILAASLLSGLVAGAFAGYNTAISDHFTLVRAVDDIEYLKSDHTSKAEVTQIIGSFEKQLTDINKNLDKLIDMHLEK